MYEILSIELALDPIPALLNNKSILLYFFSTSNNNLFIFASLETSPLNVIAFP